MCVISLIKASWEQAAGQRRDSMILSVIQHASALSACPRQYRPLTTLMYDAITKLIKASSRNKVPVEVKAERKGGGGGGAMHQPA